MVNVRWQSGEVWIMASDHFGDDDEAGSHAFAAALDGLVAPVLCAVVDDGRQAGEFADGLVGERADFGQFGQQAGDGAVGDALDDASRVIERGPTGIGVNQLGDAVSMARVSAAIVRRTALSDASTPVR